MGTCTSSTKGSVKDTQSPSPINSREPLSNEETSKILARSSQKRVNVSVESEFSTSESPTWSKGCRVNGKEGHSNSYQSFSSQKFKEKSSVVFLDDKSGQSKGRVQTILPSQKVVSFDNRKRLKPFVENVRSTSSNYSVPHFKDLLSFFRSRDSFVGLVSLSDIESPSEPLSNSLFSNTSNRGFEGSTSATISQVFVQSPPSTSSALGKTSEEEKSLSQPIHSLMNVPIPSHNYQYVLFPNSSEQMCNLHEICLSTELQNLCQSSYNYEVLLSNSQFQQPPLFPFYVSSEEWLWKSLISYPDSIDSLDSYNAAVVFGRRAYFLLLCFTHSKGPLALRNRYALSQTTSKNVPNTSALLGTCFSGPLREWNSERRALRAALLISDLFASETEQFLAEADSRNDEKDIDQYVEVAPSYPETGELFEIPVNQGGLDGSSLLHQRCKGCLIAQSGNNNNNNNNKVSLSVSQEIEPLCDGLVWKTIVQEGKNWRLPTPSCVANIEIGLIASTEKDILSFSQIERCLRFDQNDMLCTKALLPLSAIDKHNANKTIIDPYFGTKDPDLSVLFHNWKKDVIELVESILKEALRLTCRTMKQDEICLISIPVIDLLCISQDQNNNSMVNYESNIVFFVKLNSWQYVQFVEVDDNGTKGLLRIERYNRTITTTSSSSTSFLIDYTPQRNDTVKIEIYQNDQRSQVTFCLMNKEVPNFIKELAQKLTTKSKAYMWVPANVVDDPFWPSNNIDMKKSPTSGGVTFNASLISIVSFNNDNNYNTFSEPSILQSSSFKAKAEISSLLLPLNSQYKFIPKYLLPLIKTVLELLSLTEDFETFVGLIANELLTAPLGNIGLEKVKNHFNELKMERMLQNGHSINQENWEAIFSKITRLDRETKVPADSISMKINSLIESNGSDFLCNFMSAQPNLDKIQSPSPSLSNEDFSFSIGGVNFYSAAHYDVIPHLENEISLSRQLFNDFILQGSCPPLMSIAECIGRKYIAIPSISTAFHNDFNSFEDMSPDSPWITITKFIICRNASYRQYASAALSRLNGIAPLVLSRFQYILTKSSPSQAALHHITIPSTSFNLVEASSPILHFHPVNLIPQGIRAFSSPWKSTPLELWALCALYQDVKPLRSVGSSDHYNDILLNFVGPIVGSRDLALFEENSSSHSMENSNSVREAGCVKRGMLGTVFCTRTPSTNPVINESILLPDFTPACETEEKRVKIPLAKKTIDQRDISRTIFIWKLSEGLTETEINHGSKLEQYLLHVGSPTINLDYLNKEITTLLESNSELKDLKPIQPNSLFGIQKNSVLTSKELHKGLFSLNGIIFSAWKEMPTKKTNIKSATLLVPCLMSSTFYKPTRYATLLQKLHSIVVPLLDTQPSTESDHYRTTVDYTLSSIKSLVIESIGKSDPFDQTSSCKNYSITNNQSIYHLVKALKRLFKRFQISKYFGLWGLFKICNSDGISNASIFLKRCVALELLSYALKETLFLLSRIGHPICPDAFLVILKELPNLMQSHSVETEDIFRVNPLPFKDLLLLTLSTSHLSTFYNFNSEKQSADTSSNVAIASALLHQVSFIPQPFQVAYLSQRLGVSSSQPSLETLLARNLTPESTRSSEPRPQFSIRVKSNSIKWSAFMHFLSMRLHTFLALSNKHEEKTVKSEPTNVELTTLLPLLPLSSSPYEMNCFLRLRMRFWATSSNSYACTAKLLESLLSSSFIQHLSTTITTSSLVRQSSFLAQICEYYPASLRQDLVDAILLWQVFSLHTYDPKSRNGNSLQTNESFPSGPLLVICRRFLSVILKSLIRFHPWLGYQLQQDDPISINCKDQAMTRSSSKDSDSMGLVFILRHLILWVRELLTVIRSILLSMEDSAVNIPIELVVTMLICDGFLQLISSGDIAAFYELHQLAFQASLKLKHPLNANYEHWITDFSHTEQLLSKQNYGTSYSRSLKYDDFGSDVISFNPFSTPNIPPVENTEEFRLNVEQFNTSSDSTSQLTQTNRYYSNYYHPITLYLSYILSTSAYLLNRHVTEIEEYNRIFRMCRLQYPEGSPFVIGPPEQVPKALSFYPSIIAQSLGWSKVLTSSQKNTEDFVIEGIKINPQGIGQKKMSINFFIDCVQGLSNASDTIEKNLQSTSSNRRIAEAILWNLARLGPDLSIWFNIIDLPASSSPLTLSVLTDRVCCKKKDISLSVVPEKSGTNHLKSRNSVLLSTQSSHDKKNVLATDNSENVASNINTLRNKEYSVYSFGANFAAGCLGVGRPKYLRHDEALYELVNEYKDENEYLKSTGVDIWWTGIPIRVARLSHSDIVGFACGEYHTLALTRTGRLFSWGCNKFGQCGLPYSNCLVTTNEKLQSNKRTRKLLFVNLDRNPADCERWRTDLRSWSTPEKNREPLFHSFSSSIENNVLTESIITNSNNPSEYVKLIEEVSSRSSKNGITNESTHRSTTTQQQKKNIDLQRSTVEQHYDSDFLLPTAVTIPTEILSFWKRPETLIDSMVFENLEFVQIGAGASFSVARTQTGTLYAWGLAKDGCLGHGSLLGYRLFESRPTQLHGEVVADELFHEMTNISWKFKHLSWAKCNEIKNYLSAYHRDRLHRIVDVQCGAMHLGAIDYKGGLWMWGLGEAGQLGLPYHLIQLLTTKTRACNVYDNDVSNTHPNDISSLEDGVTGVISFPHRLRVFCIPVGISEVASYSVPPIHPQKDGDISSDIINDIIKEFLSEIGLKCTSDVLEQLTCRLHEKEKLLILSLADTVLLEHSSFEFSQLFSCSICHRHEVRFSLLALGEGHTLALGYTETSLRQPKMTFTLASIPQDETNKQPWTAEGNIYENASMRKQPFDIFNEFSSNTSNRQLLFSWGQSSYGQLGIEQGTQQSLDLVHMLSEAYTNSFPSTQIESCTPNRHDSYNKYEVTSRNTPCLISLNGIEAHETCRSPITNKQFEVSAVKSEAFRENSKKSNFQDDFFFIIGLRSGGCSNLLLYKSGKAMVWGANDFGMLGISENEAREISTPRNLLFPSQESTSIVDASFAMGASRLYIVSSEGDLYTLGKDSYGASGCYSDQSRPAIQYFDQQKTCNLSNPLASQRFWKVKFPPHSVGRQIVRCVAGGAIHTVVSTRTLVSDDNTLVLGSLEELLIKKYQELLNGSIMSFSGPLNKRWIIPFPKKVNLSFLVKFLTLAGDNLDFKRKKTGNSLGSFPGISSLSSQTIVSQPSRRQSSLTSSTMGHNAPVDSTLLRQVASELATGENGKAIQSTRTSHRTTDSGASKLSLGAQSVDSHTNKRQKVNLGLSSIGSLEMSNKDQGIKFSSRVPTESMSVPLTHGHYSQKKYSAGWEERTALGVNTDSNRMRRWKQQSAPFRTPSEPWRVTQSTSTGEVIKDGLIALGSLVIEGISGVNKLIRDNISEEALHPEAAMEQVKTHESVRMYNNIKRRPGRTINELPPLPLSRHQNYRTADHSTSSSYHKVLSDQSLLEAHYLTTNPNPLSAKISNKRLPHFERKRRQEREIRESFKSGRSSTVSTLNETQSAKGSVYWSNCSTNPNLQDFNVSDQKNDFNIRLAASYGPRSARAASLETSVVSLENQSAFPYEGSQNGLTNLASNYSFGLSNFSNHGTQYMLESINLSNKPRLSSSSATPSDPFSPNRILLRSHTATENFYQLESPPSSSMNHPDSQQGCRRALHPFQERHHCPPESLWAEQRSDIPIPSQTRASRYRCPGGWEHHNSSLLSVDNCPSSIVLPPRPEIVLIDGLPHQVFPPLLERRPH